jgi:tetratricopeptide (TPR) repeat protein
VRSSLAALIAVAILAQPAQAAGEDDIGSCRSGSGDARLSACTRIIESKGASPSERALAYDHRAEELRRERRYGEAVADLDRAIELDATVPRYRERGFTYYLSDQYVQAISDFDKVIAATPNDAFYLRYRAAAFLKMGDAERAFADFGKAVAAAPDDPDNYVARADAYVERKNYEMALSDLDRAIALKPDRSTSYLRRAEVLYKLGSKDKAIADVTRVTELEPNEASGYLNRALMYEDVGKFDAALADYDTLIVLKPADQWYVDRRARLIEKEGLAARPAVAAAPPATDKQTGTDAPAAAPPAAAASGADGSAAGKPNEELDCKKFVPAVNIVVSVPCLD